MSFRIAIGTCSCANPSADTIQDQACRTINANRESWRSRLPGDLAAVPEEQLETGVLGDYRVTLGTYKVALDNGDTVVAFQALVHTWSRPTFLSFGAIGRVYAEGLLVSSSGSVGDAPDDLMWQFR